MWLCWRQGSAPPGLQGCGAPAGNPTAILLPSRPFPAQILSSPTYELQGQLARCPGCSALLPPALVLLRLWREGLQAAVALEGGAAWAYFGGKRYGPGSSPVRVGTDGWIRYPVVQVGAWVSRGEAACVGELIAGWWAWMRLNAPGPGPPACFTSPVSLLPPPACSRVATESSNWSSRGLAYGQCSHMPQACAPTSPG